MLELGFQGSSSTHQPPSDLHSEYTQHIALHSPATASVHAQVGEASQRAANLAACFDAVMRGVPSTPTSLLPDILTPCLAYVLAHIESHGPSFSLRSDWRALHSLCCAIESLKTKTAPEVDLLAGYRKEQELLAQGVSPPAAAEAQVRRECMTPIRLVHGASCYQEAVKAALSQFCSAIGELVQRWEMVVTSSRDVFRADTDVEMKVEQLFPTPDDLFAVSSVPLYFLFDWKAEQRWGCETAGPSVLQEETQHTRKRQRISTPAGEALGSEEAPISPLLACRAAALAKLAACAAMFLAFARVRTGSDSHDQVADDSEHLKRSSALLDTVIRRGEDSLNLLLFAKEVLGRFGRHVAQKNRGVTRGSAPPLPAGLLADLRLVREFASTMKSSKTLEPVKEPPAGHRLLDVEQSGWGRMGLVDRLAKSLGVDVSTVENSGGKGQDGQGKSLMTRLVLGNLDSYGATENSCLPFTDFLSHLKTTSEWLGEFQCKVRFSSVCTLLLCTACLLVDCR